MSREEAVEQYKPMVLGAVRRLKYRNGLEFGDLVQEGMIGLLRAVDTFDETKGTRFEYWAGLCIRNALNTAVGRERSYWMGKEEEQEQVGLDENLVRAEDRQKWKLIMNGCLNSRERRVLKLRIWEELGFDEIGKLLDPQVGYHGAYSVYQTAIEKLQLYCQENNVSE